LAFTVYLNKYLPEYPANTYEIIKEFSIRKLLCLLLNLDLINFVIPKKYGEKLSWWANLNFSLMTGTVFSPVVYKHWWQPHARVGLFIPRHIIIGTGMDQHCLVACRVNTVQGQRPQAGGVLPLVQFESQSRGLGGGGIVKEV
jgi:hypothetical protein